MQSLAIPGIPGILAGKYSRWYLVTRTRTGKFGPQARGRGCESCQEGQILKAVAKPRAASSAATFMWTTTVLCRIETSVAETASPGLYQKWQ